MRIRGFAIAILSVAAIGLTGCSGSSDSSTDTSAPVAAATTSSAATSAEAAGEATKVDVMETEYSIELSKTDFKPGKYTFVVMNHGSRKHDLAISGPGVTEEKSSTIAGGDSTELTVTLEAGEYELWCTVGPHKSLGMDTKITVV